MDQPPDTHWGRVALDEESRLLALQTADGVVSLAAACSLEVNGERLTLQQASGLAAPTPVAAGARAELALQFAEAGIAWAITLELSADGQTVLIASRITNTGEAPVALGRCALIDVRPDAGHATLAGDDGQAVFLQTSGTTGRCRVLRAAEGDEIKLSRTLLHLVSHAAGRALHLGFVTFDRVTTFHELGYEAASGLTRLQAVCDFEGFSLAPGAGVDSETLMIEVRTDTHASLEAWADRVAAHYRPAIRPQTPVGWVGWAWVDGFNVERYEDVIIRNVQAIRRRLAGFDIEYVWVSIGNIKDGMPGDWLSFDLDNFPHGHEWLISRLAALDFRLGFWCGAFWVCSHLSELVARMTENMLRRDGEPLVSRAEWQYGAAGRMKRADRPCIYSLDPSHPRTQEFLSHVFRTYRDWGIRYYMIDFLHAISGATPGDTDYDDYFDKSLIKSPEVYRTGLATVREAAGPDTYLLSSSGPTLQNVGYMDACRVGNDYGEGRALNPESYFYPATFVINSAAFWTSHQYASDNMAASYFTHRKLYLNDSGNVMTVDKPIPVCEAQIVATIFGLSGGPAMLGDDIDRIAPERLTLIKQVLPRTPEVAFPVDLFDRPAPDYPRLFHQHVTTAWGEWEVVGVLNYGDDPLVLPVSFARLWMDPTRPCRLWEFWNEQYLGVAADEFRAVVPPRSARVYRLAACTEHPWVLSTDMHIMQGQVELADVSWDPATMTLSGTATRPAGEVGNVFLVAPQGLRVATPAGWWIAKDATDESLIIRGQFHFGPDPAEWSIRFAPLETPTA